jgi:hypothetical protein
MKATDTFKGDEISFEVLDSHEDNITELVETLVNKYNKQLRKNGLYLTDLDITKLNTNLKNEISIVLNISSNITQAKLKKWEIFPVSFKQSKLNFETPAALERIKIEAQALQDEGPGEPEDPEGVINLKDILSPEEAQNEKYEEERRALYSSYDFDEKGDSLEEEPKESGNGAEKQKKKKSKPVKLEAVFIQKPLAEGA